MIRVSYLSVFGGWAGRNGTNGVAGQRWGHKCKIHTGEEAAGGAVETAGQLLLSFLIFPFAQEEGRMTNIPGSRRFSELKLLHALRWPQTELQSAAGRGVIGG